MALVCGQNEFRMLYLWSKKRRSPLHSWGRPEPDRIAQAAATQRPKCRHCGVWLSEDGTRVELNVLPVTLEQAKSMGFKPAPNISL